MCRKDDKNKSDDKDENLRKLYIVSFICLIFMIIEIIGGYLANSIAIMSDAAHLFSDFLGFVISIVSIKIAKRQATNHMSYGFHRAEVIGALVSVTLIWGLTLWLIYEAINRIINPSPVNGGTMFIVACLGLLFNIVMGLILLYEGIDHGHSLHAHDHNEHNHSHHEHSHSHHEHNHNHDHDKETTHNSKSNSKNNIYVELTEKKDINEDEKQEHLLSENTHRRKHSKAHSHKHHNHSHENINVRAALIHIIGDAIQNIGVIISGAFIYFKPEWVIIDALCTFFFALIVFMTTIRILKDCVSVIMEGSPIENIEKMEDDLYEIEGVIEVHDLHVWSLNLGKMIMTCHLVSTNPQVSLNKACEMIHEKYGIDHSTIQVEEKMENQLCKQTIH